MCSVKMNDFLPYPVCWSLQLLAGTVPFLTMSMDAGMMPVRCLRCGDTEEWMLWLPVSCTFIPRWIVITTTINMAPSPLNEKLNTETIDRTTGQGFSSVILHDKFYTGQKRVDEDKNCEVWVWSGVGVCPQASEELVSIFQMSGTGLWNLTAQPRLFYLIILIVFIYLCNYQSVYLMGKRSYFSIINNMLFFNLKVITSAGHQKIIIHFLITLWNPFMTPTQK